MTEAEVTARLLEQVPVDLLPMRDLMRPATEMAIRLHHLAYDCVYLSLALAYGWTFVTADEGLVRKLRRPIGAEYASAIQIMADAVADP